MLLSLAVLHELVGVPLAVWAIFLFAVSLAINISAERRIHNKWKKDHNER